MSPHIDSVTSSCARSLFALRTLHAHGLNNEGLNTVYKSVVLSRLLYASPAWYGFTNAHERRRLESSIRKSVRFGFCKRDTKTFDNL